MFEKIGLFDEDLVRNQDDEFNLRLIRKGGKILFVPDIISYYYARVSLKQLWRTYAQYGYYKPLVAQKVGGVLTCRQMVPSVLIGILVFTGFLSFLNKYFLGLFLFTGGFYAVSNLSFSLIISIKNNNFKLLPFLASSYIVLHFSYGLGYLKGIWDFIIRNKHLNKQVRICI